MLCCVVERRGFLVKYKIYVRYNHKNICVEVYHSLTWLILEHFRFFFYTRLKTLYKNWAFLCFSFIHLSQIIFYIFDGVMKIICRYILRWVLEMCTAVHVAGKMFILFLMIFYIFVCCWLKGNTRRVYV